jgi:hypothetical protein
MLSTLETILTYQAHLWTTLDDRNQQFELLWLIFLSSETLHLVSENSSAELRSPFPQGAKNTFASSPLINSTKLSVALGNTSLLMFSWLCWHINLITKTMTCIIACTISWCSFSSYNKVQMWMYDNSKISSRWWCQLTMTMTSAHGLMSFLLQAHAILPALAAMRWADMSHFVFRKRLVFEVMYALLSMQIMTVGLCVLLGAHHNLFPNGDDLNIQTVSHLFPLTEWIIMKSWWPLYLSITSLVLLNLTDRLSAVEHKPSPSKCVSTSSRPSSSPALQPLSPRLSPNAPKTPSTTASPTLSPPHPHFAQLTSSPMRSLPWQRPARSSSRRLCMYLWLRGRDTRWPCFCSFLFPLWQTGPPENGSLRKLKRYGRRWQPMMKVNRRRVSASKMSSSTREEGRPSGRVVPVLLRV